MITGNPMLRTRKQPDVDDPESWALSFRCWQSATDMGPNPPGAGTLESITFPDKKCNGGIRANIFFPKYTRSYNKW